ncbi:unnamed protein product [Effrenium voratum]|nr:unnamed protein product [Effrenium voratum]
MLHLRWLLGASGRWPVQASQREMGRRLSPRLARKRALTDFAWMGRQAGCAAESEFNFVRESGNNLEGAASRSDLLCDHGGRILCNFLASTLGNLLVLRRAAGVVIAESALHLRNFWFGSTPGKSDSAASDGIRESTCVYRGLHELEEPALGLRLAGLALRVITDGLAMDVFPQLLDWLDSWLPGQVGMQPVATVAATAGGQLLQRLRSACALKASAAALAFGALAAYAARRRRQELQRRRAQRHRKARLLKAAWHGLRRGAERAQQAEVALRGVEARRLGRLLREWQAAGRALVENLRSRVMRQAFRQLRLYCEQRAAKMAVDAAARSAAKSSGRQLRLRYALAAFRNLLLTRQLRCQRRLQRRHLSLGRGRRALSRWRRAAQRACGEARRAEEQATQLHARRLLQGALSLWRRRAGEGAQARWRLEALGGAVRRQVLQWWLMCWHAAAANWRDQQALTRKALTAATGEGRGGAPRARNRPDGF